MRWLLHLQLELQCHHRGWMHCRRGRTRMRQCSSVAVLRCITGTAPTSRCRYRLMAGSASSLTPLLPTCCEMGLISSRCGSVALLPCTCTFRVTLSLVYLRLVL